MAHYHRVTMADVAVVAKVHQTTVSMSLRDDPRLPKSTRERIKLLANRLGYRPDPMLSALNFYRTSRDKAKAQPCMALVTRSRSYRPTDEFFSDDQFLKGAKRAADNLGYRLVPFPIVPKKGEGMRLSRVLQSRGIDGVILGGLDTSITDFEIEWERFSALCIETQHLKLSLHTVANNQAGVTRTAIRKLFEKGYRRIGLAVGSMEEAALGKPFSSGYLLETNEIRGLTAIRPFLIDSLKQEGLSNRLARWVHDNRIDAVISNWASVPEHLTEMGFRIPEDLAVASLDHNPRRGPVAGMRQSHELVGERAVEALALLMKTNQRGTINLPNTTFVDGVWQDGPECPIRPTKLINNTR